MDGSKVWLTVTLQIFACFSFDLNPLTLIQLHFHVTFIEDGLTGWLSKLLSVDFSVLMAPKVSETESPELGVFVVRRNLHF